MLRVAVGFMLLCALLTLINVARAESRFLETLTLRNGQRLVVEESSLEPRSIGSYSLRLYGGERPEFPYDRFLNGRVSERDGVLEMAAELDSRHCDDCFTVCMRSVGSGGYLTHHIYSYTGSILILQIVHSIGRSGMACGDLGDQRWEWPEYVPGEAGHGG